jgi:hypothetical protein
MNCRTHPLDNYEFALTFGDENDSESAVTIVIYNIRTQLRTNIYYLKNVKWADRVLFIEPYFLYMYRGICVRNRYYNTERVVEGYYRQITPTGTTNL